jgi:hypothetical protein
MINIKNNIKATIRYDVLRNGAVIKQIYAYGTPTISMISSSELKTNLSGQFHNYSALGINFMTDRLHPVITINGIEYPCGVYFITNETEKKAYGVSFMQLEGYSLLYLLKQKKIETRLSFAAGTLYTTVLAQLLIACGITSYDITASTLALATVREDWEIGTAYLTIVNQLLSEMSYNTAYCDAAGKVIMSKYVAPALDNIKFTYKADAFSIIGPDYTRSNDYHSKSNVFKVICANPDLTAPLTATSENNDAASPFSTVNIGRVLNVTTINNIASQTALQAKADELKMKSLVSSEEATFVTVINPEHTVFDTIALDNDKLTGIFSETEWTMPLSASVLMTHVARRALYG